MTTRQYGQGTAGFGKRYGADFADEATTELLGGVSPALFHQDSAAMVCG